MQLFNLRTAVTAFSAVVVLSACGGGNSSGNGPITNPTVPPKSTLVGRAALGAIVGATCNVFKANGTTPATSNGTTAIPAQMTVDGGVFNFGDILSIDFPVVVKCTGGSFFDESTGMSLSNLAEISAVVPQARTSQGGTTPTIALTPLTTLAATVFLAIANVDQRTNSAAASANTEIAKALFPNGDILTPPTPVTSTTTTLDGSVAGQYAAILAALSYAAQEGTGATPAERSKNFIESLAKDAKDGTINGMDGTTPITNAGYSSFNELVQDVKDGTQSYETANPSASGGTNAAQTQQDAPRDNTTTPTTTGS